MFGFCLPTSWDFKKEENHEYNIEAGGLWRPGVSDRSSGSTSICPLRFCRSPRCLLLCHNNCYTKEIVEVVEEYLIDLIVMDRAYLIVSRQPRIQGTATKLGEGFDGGRRMMLMVWRRREQRTNWDLFHRSHDWIYINLVAPKKTHPEDRCTGSITNRIKTFRTAFCQRSCSEELTRISATMVVKYISSRAFFSKRKHVIWD